MGDYSFDVIKNKVFDDDGAAACASKQVVSTFQLLTSSAAKWQVTLYYIHSSIVHTYVIPT